MSLVFDRPTTPGTTFDRLMQEIAEIYEGDREKAVALSRRIREAKDLTFGERATLQDTLSGHFLIAFGHKPY